MNTSHEFTQNQDPAHQAAVASISRHYLNAVKMDPNVNVPAEVTEEQLQESSQGLAEAFVGFASEPEVQELLPAIKDLVPNSVIREDMRREIGEDRYDLAVTKINAFMITEESEEAKVAKENWAAQGVKLLNAIEQHGDLPQDYAGEEFTATRQVVIDAEKEAYVKVADAIKLDEEVRQSFAGHEGDLQKFLDMQMGMVEETQDYLLLFSLAGAMSETMHADAAKQAGKSTVAITVERPQQ